MASLKSLRNRIKSVKSTQKITKAMKMVAASKLRRAREAAENARPYAEKIEQVVRSLAAGSLQMADSSLQAAGGGGSASLPSAGSHLPPLLTGTGTDRTHLLVVMTSDRGLCGAFNGSLIRAAKRKVTELEGQSKQVKLLMVGRKAYDAMKAEYKDRMVAHLTEVGKKGLSFTDAERVANEILSRFDAGEFDVATILYNRFKSAIAQIVTFQQLIPLPVNQESGIRNQEIPDSKFLVPDSIPYEYEPEEGAILADLLPRNLRVQVFRGLLENAASEQGARMTAMDNATRNAGEMIKKLTLVYNRTRQAAITKELIEIISGAEAL